MAALPVSAAVAPAAPLYIAINEHVQNAMKEGVERALRKPELIQLGPPRDPIWYKAVYPARVVHCILQSTVLNTSTMGALVAVGGPDIRSLNRIGLTIYGNGIQVSPSGATSIIFARWHKQPLANQVTRGNFSYQGQMLPGAWSYDVSKGEFNLVAEGTNIKVAVTEEVQVMLAVTRDLAEAAHGPSRDILLADFVQLGGDPELAKSVQARVAAIAAIRSAPRAAFMRGPPPAAPPPPPPPPLPAAGQPALLENVLDMDDEESLKQCTELALRGPLPIDRVHPRDVEWYRATYNAKVTKCVIDAVTFDIKNLRAVVYVGGPDDITETDNVALCIYGEGFQAAHPYWAIDFPRWRNEPKVRQRYPVNFYVRNKLTPGFWEYDSAAGTFTCEALYGSTDISVSVEKEVQVMLASRRDHEEITATYPEHMRYGFVEFPYPKVKKERAPIQVKKEKEEKVPPARQPVPVFAAATPATPAPPFASATPATSSSSSSIPQPSLINPFSQASSSSSSSSIAYFSLPYSSSSSSASSFLSTPLPEFKVKPEPVSLPVTFSAALAATVSEKTPAQSGGGGAGAGAGAREDKNHPRTVLDAFLEKELEEGLETAKRRLKGGRVSAADREPKYYRFRYPGTVVRCDIEDKTLEDGKLSAVVGFGDNYQLGAAGVIMLGLYGRGFQAPSTSRGFIAFLRWEGDERIRQVGSDNFFIDGEKLGGFWVFDITRNCFTCRGDGSNIEISIPEKVTKMITNKHDAKEIANFKRHSNIQYDVKKEARKLLNLE